MRKLIQGLIRGQWIAPGILAFLTVVLSIVAGIAVTDPRLIDYYQKALVNASDDVDRQLYSYNKLGWLALVAKRTNDAYDLYRQQLALSHHSWEGWYWGSLAHEGIARAILKMPAPDMKEAYQHARKALDAGGKVEGPRESTLRRLVIQIADTILDYE